MPLIRKGNAIIGIRSRDYLGWESTATTNQNPQIKGEGLNPDCIVCFAQNHTYSIRARITFPDPMSLKYIVLMDFEENGP